MTTQTDRRRIFGERLKELRISKGLSQAALAEQIHISATSINRYERGMREPSLNILGLIANFFSVDFNYLLCQPDELSQSVESDLAWKFRALDDRGKASVLNLLEHEYMLVSIE